MGNSDDEQMDDMTAEGGTFCKDWLAYTIRQASPGGWRKAATADQN